jgi:hypothetical protein
MKHANRKDISEVSHITATSVGGKEKISTFSVVTELSWMDGEKLLQPTNIQVDRMEMYVRRVAALTTRSGNNSWTLFCTITILRKPRKMLFFKEL